MKLTELRRLVSEGALRKYSHLYANLSRERERVLLAIDAFSKQYGADRDVYLLSVPGRSELLGNHTDHQRGKVLAGAIDRDVIAVAAKREDGIIRILSEGYPEDTVDTGKLSDPDAFENYTSSALIAGVAAGFLKHGYAIGGFDAYSTSDVLKGSGISSSAAYEVMIGNILNHLYSDGKVRNTEIAKISQFAENVYFGKPSGLMDQMACAVGGFVYIDFENKEAPTVEPLSLSLRDAGYELAIINTGGNHADLNDDYASVPAEMRSVAAFFGKEVLREVSEEELYSSIAPLRESVGDRAVLRSIHYMNENSRVSRGREAIVSGSLERFFSEVRSSGLSSFTYLQNVYTNKNVSEQGLSLALALIDSFGEGVGAFRVHGGGFAGTVQAYVKSDEADRFTEYMERVFGKGSVMRLSIRPEGAVRLF